MQLKTVTELSSGVDALYLSARAALPSGLLDRLNKIRLLADEQEDSVEFSLGSLTLQLQPRKWGLYRYCLDHPYARFGFSPRSNIPPIRVQPRAEFLHGTGVQGTVEWVRTLLERECGAVLLEVSRIDLYADFQGWQLEGDDRHEFLGRANSSSLYEDTDEFNGLTFGKRGSSKIMARLYDKTIESAKKGTAYWKDQWGDRYDPTRGVLRVEFELPREVLRQFGVTTTEEVLGVTGALWHYLTHQWLSHRVRTDDEIKSRWPVSAPWRAVQRASIGAGSLGVDRTYRAKQVGLLANVMPSLVGQLANFGALTNSDSMVDLIPNLERHINLYSRTSGRSMSSRIAEKKQRFVLP